jgi:threonine dehydratase
MIDMIRDAAGAIDPVFTRTPVVANDLMDERLGCHLVLKVETLTPIRSFKGRGADYLLGALPENAKAGVVCASAGNFGQGIAYAGRRRGVPVTVFAAESANPLKLEAMRRLGANVITTGHDFDAAKAAAEEHARGKGLTFLNDGAHPEGVAGAGTIAKELTEAGIAMDAILVPLGNGALVNGIGSWLKAKSPATEVIAVAPKGAPAMERSWRANALIETASVDTIADGLAVRSPILSAVETMQATTDDVVLAEDSTMIEAMRFLIEAAGLLVEPSGAAGLAALMADPPRFAGRRVATVLCGGNVTRAQITEWLAQ